MLPFVYPDKHILLIYIVSRICVTLTQKHTARINRVIEGLIVFLIMYFFRDAYDQTTSLCRVKPVNFTPRVMMNKEGWWKFLVNIPGFQQTFSAEMCAT